ncbi:Ingression protein fic1 [Trichoderma ghanense]|uniref:Ingression protein fic1 n=1 Tax=Trichoderma ghanense TaxID=65468 RepID=A0ABY2HA56_9HYPO
MEVSHLLPSKTGRGNALASLFQPTMALSTASKSFAINGPHTAGLFADMSVDGPVIGTLVAIVDRAKNLPNRKTIGKQDPYCAARLGKEAKKTATDVRGGQTPKWDQELRFTVHDSADYYQLKVSVFTDDKKTDLIGEAWIDLKGIIIPGGGQNDVWQTLTCRGKYAGEIRLEITFYDSRPKPEKPAARSRQSMGGELENASPKRKDIVKRRPLPTDPVTGEVTANISSQTPPDYHQTPPRHIGKSSHHSPYNSTSSLNETTEYGTPPQGSTRSRHGDYFLSHSPSGHGHSGSGRVEGPRQPRPTRQDSHERESRFSQKIPVSPYEQFDPRGSSYSLASDTYDMTPIDDPAPYPPQGGPRQAAPPPPAHRSRHSTSQEGLHRRSDEASPQRVTPPASMRSDVLKNEAHRSTTSNYPGRPQFRAYDPSMVAQPPVPKAIAYEPHNSYDSLDSQHRSMQPTVEDVPESPPGSMRTRPRRSIPPLDEVVYDAGPIPVSTGLSRSPGGVSPGFMSQSPGPYPSYQEQQPRNQNSVSPLSTRDYTESPEQMAQYSYSNQSQRSNQQREHETTYIQSSPSYGLPGLPPSLAPGVDPNLLQEMSNRAYEERHQDGRYNYQHNQVVSVSTRDRHRSEPPPPSHEPAYGASPQPYESYDKRRSGAYASGPDPHAQGYRDASPNPQHRIRRKSVSPAPRSSDNRRHSDIPFSPDSYDAFNPGVSSRDASPGLDPSDSPSKIVTHDGREIDPSDHLPEESWAPEPETKPSPEPSPTRTRPALSGAQPMPPSGRRPLRISMARTSQAMVPSTAYGYTEGPRAPPAQGGRQRLQKKTRHSMPPTTAVPNSPAPIAPDNFHDRTNPYSSTRSRAGAWDHPNDNYAPHYSVASQGPPPIPAKVPLPVMSGANGGAEDMALIQEMQKIDIGTGRSRRRGGY